MNKRRLIILTLIIALLLGIALVVWQYSQPLAEAAKDPQLVRAWAKRWGIWGYLAIIAATAVQVVMAVIPAGPVELAAGFAYGPIVGTLLCSVGFVIGSAIAFSLVKRYGERMVLFFFGHNKLKNVRFLQQKTA